MLTISFDSARRALACAGTVLATLVAPPAQDRLDAQSTTPAAAQPTRAAAAFTPITMDEAIRIALQQNPTLRQAKNASASDAASVRQQRLQLLPSLSASLSTGQSYGSAGGSSAIDGSSQTTQTGSAGLSSSLTLFDGLKNVAELRGAKLTSQASS
jgi:outer membrane protein